MRMLLQWNKVYGIIQTMVIVNILALILLVLLIADRMETSMVRAWPIGVGVLMMVLYGLSFFGALKWIDLLGALFLLTGSVYFWRKDRKLCMEKVCRKICEPSFLVALLFVILISVLVNDKCVSWWDEINFWAADVKSIFYRNGFAAKYENVAPEFGDYPPGTQLIKWWFLHMNPKSFDEGLMFAGYYFLIFSFLVPSLDRIKIKNKVWQVIAMIGWCILLWLFPTTVEAFWVEGSCADLSMAVIYGAFLVEIVSNRPKKYAFVPGLYLSCMSLCKNTSFIWLAFAGVFLLIYIQFIGEKKTFEMLVFKTGNRLMQTLIILAMPVLVYGSWWSFCLLNRRVAAHTGNAIHMATGSLAVPEYQEVLAQSFATAFVKWPLHRYANGLVNLSPLAFLLFFTCLFFVLVAFRKIGKKQGIFLGIFTLVSGVLFYLSNLVCHLTIFAAETQYLEPFAMVSSIERYGAPFTIGTMMLAFEMLSGIPIIKMKKKPDENIWAGAFILAGIFILFTCDYSNGFKAIHGYRGESEKMIQSRKDIVGDEAEKLKAIYPDSKGYGRVLYAKDRNNYSWVQNTYISYEMSPVSVMYSAVNMDTVNEQELLALLDWAHAKYVYIDGNLYENDGGKLTDAAK